MIQYHLENLFNDQGTSFDHYRKRYVEGKLNDSAREAFELYLQHRILESRALLEETA